MFTPEQLRSAAEVLKAMASQTTPIGHTNKRPMSKPHSLVRRMHSLATGRQGDQSRNDQDQVENSKTPTEALGGGDDEEHQFT